MGFGLLTATAAVIGALVWQLLVRPEVVLAYWTDQAVTDNWFSHHPAAVNALRVASGGLLFLLGFITGMALTILTQTG